MRALVSLILSSMMINLGVRSTNQKMEEDQGPKNYTGKYPKKKFKACDKYHVKQ